MSSLELSSDLFKKDKCDDNFIKVNLKDTIEETKILNKGDSDGDDDFDENSLYDKNRLLKDTLNNNYCKVRLIWHKINYCIKIKSIIKKKSFPWYELLNNEKYLLHTQSGFIKTGTLTAVIGPSGGGKSTFLECLAGRRRANLNGSIYIRSEHNDNLTNKYNIKRSTSIAFIGQKDHLLELLTVRESMIFASKLKNYGSKKEKIYSDMNKKGSTCSIKYKRENFHKITTENLLNRLGLETCADIKVSLISGGQVKRLSIALELLSKPKILILDEPTSGLDSSSAQQCVHLLKNLATSENLPLAIIASIHQPSAKILNIFDNLYILSNDGHCIYSGPTVQLLDYFSNHELQCPQFHNPADFIIEVASGDYGHDKLLALYNSERVKQEAEDSEKEYESEEKVAISVVVDKMANRSFPKLKHLFLLCHRSMLIIKREPLLAWLRIFQHIFVAIFVGMMYVEPTGSADGCFDDLIKSFDYDDKASTALESFQKALTKKHSKAGDNVTLIFFNILFIVFGAVMPVVLTFPLEMSNYMKERTNAWYGTGTFYLSKMLADLPFQIIIPILMSTVIYYMTEQIPSLWRYSMFCLVMVLIGLVSQAIGIIFGIFFVDHVNAAVSVTPIVLMPLFFAGGFFNSQSDSSLVVLPIKLISFIRYGFYALIRIMYGFDRCTLSIKDSVKHASTLSDITCMMNCTNDIKPINTLKQVKDHFCSNSNSFLTTIIGLNKNCIRNLKAYANNLGFDPCQDNFSINKFNQTVENIDKETKLNASFIMAHYSVTDNGLLFDLGILCIFIVILRIIGYFILVYKTNRRLRG